MSIVRIDPGGGRNAEHIAIIVVVDLVPIQCHFRSRRPQAQQPLYQDGHTATGPAQDGHRPAAASDPGIGRVDTAAGPRTIRRTHSDGIACIRKLSLGDSTTQ